MSLRPNVVNPLRDIPGCFACRLRGKGCHRSSSDDGCDMCRFAHVECLPCPPPLPKLIKECPKAKACVTEIRSLSNGNRVGIAKLPKTCAFAREFFNLVGDQTQLLEDQGIYNVDLRSPRTPPQSSSSTQYSVGNQPTLGAPPALDVGMNMLSYTTIGTYPTPNRCVNYYSFPPTPSPATHADLNPGYIYDARYASTSVASSFPSPTNHDPSIPTPPMASGALGNTCPLPSPPVSPNAYHGQSTPLHTDCPTLYHLEAIAQSLGYTLVPLQSRLQHHP
ncbi:uncharacterized protein EI90DRAFT_3059236 [Cantharellus anzutake]|uniref:uncharacterized protein n=1 Tax=Cantharellus anzutake TaxID=1750568 RepID=UPI00190727F8|nr:uncharacterized protein EI90DRAFT_3059236 [Cantharellus anzutake]KAF8330773.1 hypothetical protein EI90DRAFT_3059236 [Cantharellus anzutake]